MYVPISDWQFLFLLWIDFELWNCSKLLIRGSKMFSQRNSQQLHQIMTCKCGHLTISQVILTINQYKLYHNIHHKNILNVIILAAETKFHNFITYFVWKNALDFHWIMKILYVSLQK